MKGEFHVIFNNINTNYLIQFSNKKPMSIGFLKINEY